MLRALLVASLVLVGSHAASGQDIGILHITAVLVDAAGMATPVPGHALLISDEPPGAPPRRIRTAFDGTASVRLRPGAYTVESDQPVVFDGQAYHWTQHVVIVAAGDAVLELTIDNAAIDADASTTASAAPPTDDPAFLMPRWQDSVVAIWTPSTHASGFLIDGKGLIATNQRAIGSLSVDTTAIVEVQLSPDVKVAARVLVGAKPL